jgi:hypothetical protein
MDSGALFDDDFANTTVIQHLGDVVIAGQQGLWAEVQLGIHLNGLRFGFLRLQDAKAGIKAQASE